MTPETERAASYKQLMELWAFKDFLSRIKVQRESEMNTLIMKDDNITRGKIQAFDWIDQELNYILSNG